MRLDILMALVLCWASVTHCLQTTEVSLKFLNNKEFQLNITIGNQIERFRLIKKNANVPTMLAGDNGVISNLQSLQVDNSQTSFNPDISQLNLANHQLEFYKFHQLHQSFVFRLTRFTKILTIVHL